MVVMARWFKQLPLPGSGPIRLYHASLEATLIHSRLLIEFLIGRRRKNGPYRNSNDIGANDLIPNWDDRTELDVAGLYDFCDMSAEQMARPSVAVAD